VTGWWPAWLAAGLEARGHHHVVLVAPRWPAAAGLPLVARDDGSRTGPVVDGHTGVLADDDDELVAEAIRIGRDPVRRERLGAAARSMAAVHTDQVHLDRMERLYRELLAARAPNRHPAPSAHR
jgi:glycosyltransferase involved in cell wall biosynthesis